MDEKALLFYMPYDKQQLILRISNIILSSSVNISETIKFGRLTYIHENEPVAFICSKQEKSYVELGFFKAVYLDDPKRLFKGKAKEIRRIRIHSIKEIPVMQIKRWIAGSLKIMDEFNK